MTADQNGWQDSPEDERETAGVMEQRCGLLLYDAAQLIYQAMARIARQKIREAR